MKIKDDKIDKRNYILKKYTSFIKSIALNRHLYMPWRKKKSLKVLLKRIIYTFDFKKNKKFILLSKKQEY